MKVIIYGATGMVGQSVLNECLKDDGITEVVTIGRSKINKDDKKLKDIVLKDVTDLSSVADEIRGFNACYFCLGVSSVGMSEEDYTKITYDITMNVANELARLNTNMTFIYVSGMSTDSTESGKIMWARVKGKTENDLMKLPFKSSYMFRPGVIIPAKGVKSKTKLYHVGYTILRPLFPLMNKSKSVISSEQIGRAMIKVTREGYKVPVIESVEIKEIDMK